MDPFDAFKDVQRQGWAHFAPLEFTTMVPAGRLVKFAGVTPGASVLDVACGTGVVAISAARLGAKVSGLDLTPELLERARFNAQTAGFEIEFHEGDAEKLPFGDATFDFVISQYGHMFAPRPEVALSEMLRVLKPGGTIAFSTWPPDLFVGQMFRLIARAMPPPPVEVPSPTLWGEKTVILQRLSASVRDVTFESKLMLSPALSPQHFCALLEKNIGSLVKLIEIYEKADPAKLDVFRREMLALVKQYFEDNVVRQEYLSTRAVKN